MAVTYGPFYIWLGGGFNHLEVIKCKLQFPCKTTAQIRVALYVQNCIFANMSVLAFRAAPPPPPASTAQYPSSLCMAKISVFLQSDICIRVRLHFITTAYM